MKKNLLGLIALLGLHGTRAVRLAALDKEEETAMKSLGEELMQEVESAAEDPVEPAPKAEDPAQQK